MRCPNCGIFTSTPPPPIRLPATRIKPPHSPDWECAHLSIIVFKIFTVTCSCKNCRTQARKGDVNKSTMFPVGGIGMFLHVEWFDKYCLAKALMYGRTWRAERSGRSGSALDVCHPGERYALKNSRRVPRWRATRSTSCRSRTS